MTKHSRAELIDHARASIARGSKSFRLASRLFDRETRERVWLLYAWCRRCDDLADGQQHGGALDANHDSAAALGHIRALTGEALAGRSTGDPAFDALGLVARETALTPAMAEDVIQGFALDAEDWRPRSQADLIRYCYHVAGAVGAMMAVVMGIDPQDRPTLDRAAELGIAFQLANILRDLMEDDAAGRCYLPIEWLVEQDFAPGQHMKPHNRAALVTLAERVAHLSRNYARAARSGVAALPFRSRWAVLASARIYGGIAEEVVVRGPAAWDHRVVVGRPAKLRHLAAALWEARRSSQLSGPVLWSSDAAPVSASATP